MSRRSIGRSVAGWAGLSVLALAFGASCGADERDVGLVDPGNGLDPLMPGGPGSSEMMPGSEPGAMDPQGMLPMGSEPGGEGNPNVGGVVGAEPPGGMM